ncbi:MAG: UvrD-helicase domain-containing protein, partial [Synergistaceae bacterium]|nr:UvrD-helicase domain-containing protein [Synergistaceae bacterium]
MDMKELFNKRVQGLCPWLPENTPQGQKQAVNSNKQIITVTAGAGTGKTWVLSNRYARLLLSSNEVLPKDILTLTYT